MSNAIEIRDLEYRAGKTFEVRDLAVNVPTGAMYGFLGPNGAGKTTCVEILEGLRDPTGGEARVLGVDVRTDYRKIRERVGVLPQDFEPFDRLRPTEAVAYWAALFNRRITKVEVAALIETVGLTARAKSQAMYLSGGEKRRLGIALALVGKPDLVFLDEPTTGLDPGARRDLWALIRGLKQMGKTVILTTHYLDEAEQLADHVAIMNKGKIVARGTPDELIRDHGQGTRIVLAGAGAAGQRALTARGIESSLENGNVIVRVSAASEMRGMLAKLAAIDVPLTEIFTQRDTLEEVFLHVVGARMREGVLAE